MTSGLQLCWSLGCGYGETRSEVIAAAVECQELSNTALLLCQDAQSKGESLVNATETCERDMRGFGSITSWEKLMNIMNQNQTRQAVSACTDMDDEALKILETAQSMSESLTKAIDSLPDDVREEYQEKDQQADASRGINDGEQPDLGSEYEELQQLMQVEQDIADLENVHSTSRGGGLNFFSASTIGTRVFEQVKSKGEKVRLLFGQMATLCQNLAKLAASFTQDTNCCAQFRALVSTIASLFKCHNLARLLALAAQAVMRLVQAIGQILQSTWQALQGFLAEFQAAKKIGSFVSSSLNFVSSVMSSSGKSRS